MLDIKSCSIFIATPLYSDPTAEYTISIFETIKLFYKKEIKFKIHYKKRPYVTRARNLLVNDFLNSNCTHLLFIDADIQFNPNIIEKMLLENKEILCVLYPIKKLNYEKALEMINKNLIKTTEDLQKFAFNDYPYIKKNSFIEKGILEVEAGPTGFMMIKREVFEKMISFYGNKMKLNNKNKDKNLYNFFDNLHIPENQAWYGDDYAFCIRWRNTGGKVYVMLNNEISHIGTHAFTGCFNEKELLNE